MKRNNIQIRINEEFEEIIRKQAQFYDCPFSTMCGIMIKNGLRYDKAILDKAAKAGSEDAIKEIKIFGYDKIDLYK